MLIASKEFHLAADHPDLDGHFPGFSLLPGVSQISLAVDLLAQTRGSKFEILEIKKAKFRSMLQPPQSVRVDLTEEDHNQIYWRIFTENKVYSEGFLVVDFSQ